MSGEVKKLEIRPAAATLDQNIAFNKTFCFQACLVALVVLCVAEALPFNAVGPFYNGDAASAPSFDIKEHTWPGLKVKTFTLGGR